MKKILIMFALLSAPFNLHAEEKNPVPLKTIMTNIDLEDGAYAKKFTNQKKSAVGNPVKINVFYKSKSKPPSNNFLVELLDGKNQLMPKQKSGRYIWLVGNNNNLATLQEGERYTITGILVEDQGYYGALVVYARSITKIARQRTPIHYPLRVEV